MDDSKTHTGTQRTSREQPSLVDEVGRKESRKLRARKRQDRTVWFGLGMFGLIGWAVSIPLIIGVSVGLWLDEAFPSRISWTLTFILVGIALGCLNAWYWLSKERKTIEYEAED